MHSLLRARMVRGTALGVALAVVSGGGVAYALEPQTTTRISIGYDGSQANGDSNEPSVSNNGRWLAYSSNATNLVPGDTNGLLDIFMYDRLNGTTELVTRGIGGAPTDRASLGERMSANGRFLTFYSEATNLVPGDTDGENSVFVWDRRSKSITSVPGANSLWPDISADGRFVTYSSYAALVPEDTNEYIDVYVYDRVAGVTSLITRTTSGQAAGGYESAISDDGRYVAFGSSSRDLTAEPVGGEHNVFLHDRLTGTAVIVSASADGSVVGRAGDLSISGNGRFVSFASGTNNLVPADTNNEVDIFLWNRETGEIILVSATPDGKPAPDAFSYFARVNANGRYVTFWSTANNLSGTEAAGYSQVYLFDREARRNSVVAVPVTGTSGGGEAGEVSANGKVVGFSSGATDLVPGDTNARRDVFVSVMR